jgi:SAM-dependent methyltransferase
VLGTDIAEAVLARARAGLFTQFEVQRGLAVQRLVRHFRQEDGGRWRIAPELRSMARFERWNLLDDLGALGRFDVNFCRNVLIYFDPPTKARVLAGLAARLAPDGVLYLGGAETVLGLTDRLVPLPGQRGAYALPVPAALAGYRSGAAPENPGPGLGGGAPAGGSALGGRRSAGGARSHLDRRGPAARPPPAWPQHPPPVAGPRLPRPERGRGRRGPARRAGAGPPVQAASIAPALGAVAGRPAAVGRAGSRITYPRPQTVPMRLSTPACASFFPKQTCCALVNRPGFAGGWLAWVTPP